MVMTLFVDRGKKAELNRRRGGWWIYSHREGGTLSKYSTDQRNGARIVLSLNTILAPLSTDQREKLMSRDFRGGGAAIFLPTTTSIEPTAMLSAVL